MMIKVYFVINSVSFHLAADDSAVLSQQTRDVSNGGIVECVDESGLSGSASAGSGSSGVNRFSGSGVDPDFAWNQRVNAASGGSDNSWNSDINLGPDRAWHHEAEMMSSGMKIGVSAWMPYFFCLLTTHLVFAIFSR